jgi:hypothetical protein
MLPWWVLAGPIRSMRFVCKLFGGETYEQGVIGPKPEAIETWTRGLAEQFPGQQIAVCLEQSKGGLIYALLKYDFLVLYPVNPGFEHEKRKILALFDTVMGVLRAFRSPRPLMCWDLTRIVLGPREDLAFNRWATECIDGARAITRYDASLNRYGTDVINPPQGDKTPQGWPKPGKAPR